METTGLQIKTTESVTGTTFKSIYVVPKTVVDKVLLYGEELVNFLVESRITSTLRHKCNIMLQLDKTEEEITKMLSAWIPSLKSFGKITEEKIRAEKDPEKRKEMIQRKIQELEALEDL